MFHVKQSIFSQNGIKRQTEREKNDKAKTSKAKKQKNNNKIKPEVTKQK